MSLKSQTMSLPLSDPSIPASSLIAFIACIDPIIHIAKDHVATYEVVVAELTWKQARERTGSLNIFGIFTKEGTSEAWEKAIRMLDNLADVEMEENFKG